MHTTFYPLLFTPVYKDYIWGGQRLRTCYARTETPAVCAESWEISAHADGLSLVSNGPLAGQSLATLAKEYGAALTGTCAPQATQFPLLFKLIDAQESLSVQVHPADDTAAQTGGEPKNEAWYVVDRTPGAALYAGLKAGTTIDSFRMAMTEGTAPQQLFHLPVEPGDALFIPGGLVHAIGAGCLIFEVQQTSNTTYRLYDWGRVDAQGNSRPLHVQQAFQVIDAHLPEPHLLRLPATPPPNRNAWQTVLNCNYFTLHRTELRAAEQITLRETSFCALFALSGKTIVSVGGIRETMIPGTSCLIPAKAGSFTLQPADQPSTVLLTTLNRDDIQSVNQP